ncbi:MAG: hypothetical protein ABSF98_19535 [Bryobacteraceae bacterium]
MEAPPKRRGRPPEGLGKKGEPDRIRDYPRQLFTMRPATKARLKAIAEHENRSEWRVVEDSIASYFEHMTPKDRRTVEAIFRRAATARD